VTGFYRVQREAVSEVEDSFTIILQYSGAQKDLLVTVKTAVITPMAQQLKYWVRGTNGSYIKWQQRSTCPQEEQIEAGIEATDPKFGTEPERFRGTLTTYEEFNSLLQKFDPETKKYTGQVPTIVGRWVGLYENVAHAILGKAELAVKASDVRDCIRVLELARESHDKGVTLLWK
jgi:predicted dehydrogenase